MVVSWAPHELNDMVLPPCHYAFQVYINNGRIDLLWQQRSADVFLGLPYDIVMYGLLLELLAKHAGLKPGQLIGQLGDCHLYNNHLEQAKEYIARPQRVLPTLELDKTISLQTAITMDDRANKHHGLELTFPEMKDIRLKGYNPYPNIPAPLSVGK
jgi:thymidylate synthase